MIAFLSVSHTKLATLEFTETQPSGLGRVEDDDNLSLQFPTGSVFGNLALSQQCKLGGKEREAS